MDETRGPQFSEDARGIPRFLRAIVGSPGIEGAAGADDVVQRPHGLLERRAGVVPVRIEDLHVLQTQPLQALVATGHQVLARAWEDTMSSSRCGQRSAAMMRPKFASAEPGGGP